MRRTTLSLVMLLICAAVLMAEDETLLLRQPTINGQGIVFVYGGDLWTVPSSGGEARRLTSHPGEELWPKYSPDGSYIAFSAQYDGNMDVFVIPTEGGVPKRLTYHPAPDLVVGWNPDGKRVVFDSGRHSYSGRFPKLFTVEISGGFPQALPMPMAWLASYSPDGSQIAYTPLPNAFNTWRKYRGGQTTPIWLFNFADNSIKEVPHQNASDTFPMWIGDTICFLSDREGTMNLFACDIKSEQVKRLTDHTTFDIKSASAGGGLIVYECGGHLYVLDPTSGKANKLSVRVPAELINLRPRYIEVEKQILSLDLSPTGVRAAFEAHGEVLTVPAKKGDIRNLTQSPGACDRYPAWSPAGKRIAYFSDASGEYELYIVDQKATEKPTRINLGTPNFYYSPRWSPDGKKLAYTDKHLHLYYIDLDKKQPVLVDTDTYSHPERSLDPVWSPDSNWIAYAKRLDNHLRAIFLYSLEKGEAYQVTDGMSDANSPVFDRNGKYLYFAASTNVGLTTGWLDLTSLDRRVIRNIYVAVLRKELPSPLAPESDEEKEEVEKEKKEEPKKEPPEKKEEAEFRIDLENLDQRILALPMPPGDYSHLSAGEEGILFYLEALEPGRQKYNLHRFDMKEREAKPFLTGINAFDISHDGKRILYASEGVWGIVNSSGKVNVGDGKINTAAMEVRINPRAEWKQMLREAWRINRDFFYDPGMHGIDWAKIYDRYAAFLPYVAHRSDLNFLIGGMIGELQVGHAYVEGGEYPKVERVPGGLLGTDYEIVEGRYRIKKVYSGLNWNPDLRAPLTEPGTNVKEGDYILRVNGRELKAPTNIYSLFEKTAGKMVTLTVNSKPLEEGSRTVTVVPVADEMSLRNRDWVEGNRRLVDKLSNGRVSYVYLPNTAGAGYIYFNRYYFAQLGKEGLVVDERFNGGGQAADYIVDMLGRPLLSYWSTRDGKDFPTPLGSIFGPKAMIINEYAGSGGDALPWYFRRRELGPLIGKRTWGGLIGVYDYPPLMDGGYVTAPRLAFWNPEGEWDVENIGVSPDIEVEMTPAEVIAGRDPQLEKAVEVVLEAIKKQPFKRPPRPPYPIKK